MNILGSNTERMQSTNRSLVLQILLQRRTCSRVELAQLTGLSQAAITKIVTEMIALGLICEGGHATGKKGRRTIEITLNKDLFKVIAVKLARQAYTIAVACTDGQIIKSECVSIPYELEPIDVLQSITAHINQYRNQYSDVKAVGMAVPGPYLSSEGRIALMSEFHDWSDIDIRQYMSDEFDIPVIIEHDANAGAIGEWTYGPKDRANSKGTLVSILAGDGISAGVICDGLILRGVTGTAGEVGHMSINIDGPRCACGNNGCLELYCSALAFVRSVKEGLAANPQSSLHKEKSIKSGTVFRHMRCGDAYARQKVEEMGTSFGYALANIIYLYNPDEIVLTDVMADAGSPMLNSALQVVERCVLPALYERTTIRITNLAEDPIVMGAAVLATKTIFDNPRGISADGTASGIPGKQGN